MYIRSIIGGEDVMDEGCGSPTARDFQRHRRNGEYSRISRLRAIRPMVDVALRDMAAI
jgi:hypothetical protein